MPLTPPWIPKVLDALPSAVRDDPAWAARIDAMLGVPQGQGSLHLAVFVEPYLGFVLDGSKTIESRFSGHRIAPYRQVLKGDLVLLKAASGPICGICEVTEVWDYRLDRASWQTIRKFTTQLRAEDPAFWESRSSASYATLMQVGAVRRLPPIDCDKRDRRGWVVLHAGSRQLEAALG